MKPTIRTMFTGVRMKAITCLFIAVLTFELVAQLAAKFRPLSPYAVLTAYPANPSFLTNEKGFRSEIDRGQVRKWAAIGTSFTLNDTLPHEEIWSTLVQSRIRNDGILLQNYSAHGGFRALSGALHLTKESGEKYEKIFISLTLRRLRPNDDLPFPEYNYSSTYLSNSAFVSWPILLKLLKDLPESKLLGWADSFHFLDQAHGAKRKQNPQSETGITDQADDIHLCYRKTMVKNNCQNKFVIGTQVKGLSAKEAYETVYLPCQLEVDSICGVPKRSTYVGKIDPSELDSYRIQIAKLAEQAKPLAQKIYFISQGLYRNPDGSLAMLAKDSGVSAAFIAGKNTFRALTPQASLENATMKNDTIRTLAKHYVNGDDNEIEFLDFQEHIDKFGSQAADAYLDYAHLSAIGNRIYADYLLENSDRQPSN